MARRVIAAFTVTDDWENVDLAMAIDYWLSQHGDEADTTVWEWNEFWQDVTDEVVSPNGDTTTQKGETA